MLTGAYAIERGKVTNHLLSIPVGKEYPRIIYLSTPIYLFDVVNNNNRYLPYCKGYFVTRVGNLFPIWVNFGFFYPLKAF